MNYKFNYVSSGITNGRLTSLRIVFIAKLKHIQPRGPQEEQAKNKIKDNELLSMFTRIQSLDKADVGCIKNMLNAYILKTDLQQKLAR